MKTRKWQLYLQQQQEESKMLLACRCLANLIEAMPYAAHSIVSLGAVPILNSKLMEIEFIDLAEQVLQVSPVHKGVGEVNELTLLSYPQTLEKISGEYPSAIVREDGLQAMLQYLDFFNIHVQRTAMTAAANCCRRLSAESCQSSRMCCPTATSGWSNLLVAALFDW
jgi:E3 ubiquitin-protein ligase TRIP12